MNLWCAWQSSAVWLANRLDVPASLQLFKVMRCGLHNDVILLANFAERK